jgi:hypothetical protein
MGNDFKPDNKIISPNENVPLIVVNSGSSVIYYDNHKFVNGGNMTRFSPKPNDVAYVIVLKDDMNYYAVFK